jgi:hypothetical protein
MRALILLWLLLMLTACTATYGPGELPEDQPDVAAPVCAEGDTRPGCQAENPACIDPHNYLCGPD